ncbi:TetR/AcrR family transcriptional regulator [Leptospira yasudae]|uniref:TetR/AcrR family transcriptional regulator n=1 Tax=Leptospira yasudae TaxID=2202201 RepID=A0A5F2EAE3_9LEPT|nr:TetR/AcrR family transcriptional regulator [Leptospira yasudae]MBW0435837.1 TetR/AcrR family transcriptional regulator [Leptospira yasudae]TGL73836.1 TetR/AcrR family transcriptional regulator [Leptospira yasudae]TGL79419.1 TetR/AcrR family transcriptional regulator [Leptospira yasudae]TGL85335.1 TetR/AcrR family transcriptional regulator [Leptospira yasudae]TGM97933.1 TetR/AcrR family transcriptional regulator [Leptospira yasudae]
MEKFAQNKQKGKERRDDILQCARGFFFTKGYDSTSVHDIIDELGIAKGTFYHHFNSKEELLMELIKFMSDELTAQLLSDVNGRNPKNTLDKLKIIHELHFDWVNKNPEMVFFFLKAIYLPENQTLKAKLEKEIFKRDVAFLKDLIAEGQKDGSFSTTMPAEFLAEAIVAMGNVQNEKFAFYMLGFNDIDPDSIYEDSKNSHYLFSSILGIKDPFEFPFPKEELSSAAENLRKFSLQFEKQNQNKNNAKSNPLKSANRKGGKAK